MNNTTIMNENTLFIDTNLDTHLALVISHADTVVDLKRKIMDEHSLCFPDLGQIRIHAVKIKLRKCFYHLTDHMLVKHAFTSTECSWFLYVDASRNAHMAQAVNNLISNGTTKKLCLAADLGVNTSNGNILKELEVEVKHMSDDQCNTTHIEACTGQHPSFMKGSGQEMNVPDEKADDAAVQMQYKPCFNSQEISSAGDVVMHEDDKSEEEPTKNGKETEPFQNIDEEVVPPKSCEPIHKGETGVAISPKYGNETEPSQNIDDEVVPPKSCEPIYKGETGVVISSKYWNETEAPQNIGEDVVPPENCQLIDQSETGVAISSTVFVNNEVVDPLKSIGGEKKSKKRKKKDERNEVTLVPQQTNNNVLAIETTLTELVDSETVNNISLGVSEKVHKEVENMDELVQPIQVEESLVLPTAKGMKKSRKKSKLAVQNLSDVQTIDHDGVGHSTPYLDSTQEKAHKDHEDADDSSQPTQSERIEGSIVLPKGRKKSKKKIKHGAEENLSDIQMKGHGMAHSTPSIEKTKVSSTTEEKSNKVETGSENLKNESALQSEKVTDDYHQQLNKQVPDSVEVLGNNLIDEIRSEGKIEAIVNATKADHPPRANDKHDSETESKISTLNNTGRVSRSHKSDKLVPKTGVSFHDAFTKKKKSVVDKLGKKKSGSGKKTLLAKTNSSLKDGEGACSADDGTVDADATKALSDNLSSSDETDLGSYIIKRKGDDSNSKELLNMDLDAVLKSSIRYKKAKISLEPVPNAHH